MNTDKRDPGTPDYTTAPYLAISPGCYGRGFTVDEAKRNLKAQGGTLARYMVYRLPAGAVGGYVDNFGGICWEWTPGADTTATGETVYTRGARR